MRAGRWVVVALVGCGPSRPPLLPLAPPPSDPCIVRHDEAPKPIALRGPLDAVIVEEELALRKPVLAMWIYGADLPKARELLERWAVFADGRASREIEEPDLLNGSTVILRARYADGSEQRITLGNCPARNVCMFFREAYEARLLERLPDTCARSHLAHADGDRCVMIEWDPACVEAHMFPQ